MRYKAFARISVLVLSVLLLLSATPEILHASYNLVQNDGVISVYGEAEIELAPDNARVILGVETTHSDSQTAVAENAKLMEQVYSAIEQLEDDIVSISTGSFYVYSTRIDEKIVYRVSNQVNISISNLDRIGELIDLATKAGANSVQSITFEVDDVETAKLFALENAVKQARDKANAIARAAGLKIESVVSISEELSGYTPFKITDQRAAYVAEMSSTVIQPQNITVSARVTANFKFAPLDANGVEEVYGNNHQEIGDSLKNLGMDIPAEEIVEMGLYNLNDEQVKPFTNEEIVELVELLNTSRTYNGFYPMVLVGNYIQILFKDGSTIRLTSFGSEDYVVLSGEIQQEFVSTVIISPKIGRILLGIEVQ